ncbi:RNA methyltransferase [Skermanella mucosa]|uniref:TrmH family RNA methyltransferase n=1 Tax=Skermanella mucosa TaxID=1789672 RepID=UPI00192BF82E|nr:RNA methyltransferase [Skermanella mucosa]UEM18732.1 RNA methyltransferase [Skermanella mucosa]
MPKPPRPHPRPGKPAGAPRFKPAGRRAPGRPAPELTDRPERPEAPQEKLLRITGLPAVSALFQRNGRLVERLFFDERNAAAVAGFCRDLAKARKPYRQVDADELARVAGTVLHGGVVAVTRPRPLPAFDPAEASRWAAEGKPLLILDGIGNPHNLGAIVRTAAFFGLERIVISDHPAQAGPSEASYRVAEGGMEHVRLYRATGFARVLKQLASSYRVLGTALGRGESLDQPADRRPTAIVLGNEEDGLGRETLDACEGVVTLSGSGRVQSLNVAATAAILIHDLTRARPSGRQAGLASGARAR